MDKILEDKLIKKYPMLYKNHIVDNRTCLSLFGFECDDGWYDIIDTLSYQIETQNKIEKSKCENCSLYIKFFILLYNLMLNEKVFYVLDKFKISNTIFKWLYEYMNEYLFTPIEVQQIKEKYGTLRFYTNYTSNKINEFIERAEKLSAHTCEVCGEDGTIQKINNFWIKTICDKCLKERNMKWI